MQSTERRKQLVEWLNEAGSLSLAEMVERFGVSKMTIHRDLTILKERNALKRIHGGVTRVNNGISLANELPRHSPEQLDKQRCLICSRSPSENLLYYLSLSSGEQKVACCPHCGISAHLMLGDRVVTALTADFLTGRLHSAHRSFFVLGSIVAHCCKPSILTFDDQEMAQRFQQGFGGEVGSFENALAYLEKDTAIHSGSSCPHCAPLTIKKL